ncbi:MAG: glycerophosphodiester phosphodiesterase family protein [Kofleriaceae bacterium]
MRFLAIVVACACSTPVAAVEAPEPVVAIARPRIVAHRGASYDAPENTLVAFRKAWALGVECVELDVHVTKDGEVVVIHDPTTKRIGGRNRAVADQTLAEIRELDAGAWKAPEFAGERIPTLAEALATIPSGHTLFVEMKTGPETAAAIARAIRSADPRPRGAHVALQSIDPDALAALAAELPDLPAFWTAFPPLDDRDQPLPYPLGVVGEAVRRKFAGLALLHPSVTEELYAEAKRAGIAMDVWTINDPRQLAALAARDDIRWIETDRPELFRPYTGRPDLAK